MRKILAYVAGVLLGIIIGTSVMILALATGCAPEPTTRLNLATGEYSSPKDIKAQRIAVDVRDLQGNVVKHVEMEGLDSSASSVIAAQAEAMKAQAEAFRAVGDGISKLADKLASGAVQGAVKAVKGPIP